MIYYGGMDPSLTNTALVVLSESGTVCLLVNSKEAVPVKLGTKKKPVEHDALQRMLLIDKALSVRMEEAGIPWPSLQVAYEDYSHNSVHRAFTLGELGGVLKCGLLQRGAGLTLVEPKVVKKFATGRGDAGKERMVEQARKEMCLGVGLPLSDDAADAYFLAKYIWYKSDPKGVIKHETSRERLRERLEYVRKK